MVLRCQDLLTTMASFDDECEEMPPLSNCRYLPHPPILVTLFCALFAVSLVCPLVPTSSLKRGEEARWSPNGSGLEVFVSICGSLIVFAAWSQNRQTAHSCLSNSGIIQNVI